MAPTDPLLALRTITTLLNSTADAQLPAQTPFIADALYAAPVLTSAFLPAKKHHAEEGTALLHKLKTRISALLQSRCPQARWTGIVLVKCAFESSYEALAAWGSTWVKLLVPLLSRPEPSATFTILVRTLTRIFTHLTASNPTLTREIVTPHLPSFIGALLHLATASAEDNDTAVLASTLEALRDLLETHAVTFRPFSTKARILTLDLLRAGTNDDIEALARELFVLLHLCASNSRKRAATAQSADKTSAVAAEWTGSFAGVVTETQHALNKLLEPVTEEMEFRFRQHGEPENLGLEPEVLLRLLATYIATPTPAQPFIPLPSAYMLTTRILAATATSPPNAAVEAHTRALLLLRLPALHVEAINLLITIHQRFTTRLLGFVPTVLETLSYLPAPSASVRAALYPLLTTLLTHAGAALDKPLITTISPLLAAACDDLTPLVVRSTSATPLITATTAVVTETYTSVSATALTEAATELITAALHYLPAELATESRIKLERTACLTGHTPALLAATLWPRPDARGSLVAHMVGAGVDATVEALVRPRLPVVWTGRTWKEEREKREEEEEEEEEGEGSSDEEMVQNHTPAPPVQGMFGAQPVQEQEAKRRKTTPPPPPPPFVPTPAPAPPAPVQAQTPFVAPIVEVPVAPEETPKNVWKGAEMEVDSEDELEIPEIMMGGDSESDSE